MIPLTLLLLLQETGRSRTVPHLEGQGIEILVPISAPDHHVATVISFPEESIEAVVAGWNEQDLSLERRRETLFIKLLRKAEGDIHVLGAGGRLYRLSVKPGTAAFDSQVRIVRPEKSKPRLESIELARAMRLGGVPEGVSVRRAEEVLWKNDQGTARARYVYDAPFHRGYVVEITAADSVRLDLSRFLSRDLVLIGARDLVIEKDQSTLLYLVFWK